MEDHSGPLPAGPQVAGPLGTPEKGLCASYALLHSGRFRAASVPDPVCQSRRSSPG